MRTLNTLQKTPPGGFKYFVPETSRWVPSATDHPYGHLAMSDLLDDLRKHYGANRIEPPPNLPELVQDQMCTHLPGGWCNEAGVQVNDPHVPSWMLDFHRLKSGTMALLRWAAKGGKFVEQAEADRRAQICIGCHWNMPAAGCTSCNLPALHQMIDQIRMGRRTAYDSALNGCGVCGCSLKAKVWFPLDVIKPEQTDAQKSAFPSHCWAK